MQVMTNNARRTEILIKTQLGLQGLSLSDVARRLDVSPQFISQVIRGRKRSRRVQCALASILGFSYPVLWED